MATVCANLATVSAVMSGRSPLSTTTETCVMPQALECDLYGVAGAQALGLLNALDLGGTVSVGAVDEGAHLVGVAADDDHDAAAAGLDGSVDASTGPWACP